MQRSKWKRRLLFLALVFLLFAMVNALPFGGWLPVGVGPAEVHRFGHGFPLKWWHDPAYVHTGKKRDQRPVLPHDQWVFDGRALAIDAAVGLVIVLTALGIRMAIQRAKADD